MLISFWLRRAVVVFALASAALAAVEWLRHSARQVAEPPGHGADYTSALVWAGVAAFVAASLTTYWAYKRSCRI